MRQFQAVAILVVTLALASAGQQSSDPTDVLLRTRERLLADLARMPRYTCVQTITRKYYQAPSHFRQPSCATLIAQHESRKHELSLRGWDRLRLEVALVNRSNVFAWVGSPRFTDDTLEQLAGRGPLGSGDFGTFLAEIFLRARVTFKQERVEGGKRMLEYPYDMPLGKSEYRVKTKNDWVLTPYSGTLVLDPEESDIVELTVRTGELPEDSSACQAISQVTYGRASIHERMVLVPRETRLRAIDRPGSESFSVTSFASCREYASTVRFLFDESPAEPTATPAAATRPLEPIPAGIRFKTRIVTPIDSDTAAAGDPIEAVLRSPLRDKKNSVLAPVGARLHGRLRRFEQASGPFDHFEIVVQLDSVEIGGIRVPLLATSDPPRPRRPDEDRSHRVMSQDYDPWNSAVFHYWREPHLRLKELDSEWITVSANEIEEAANAAKRRK